MSFITKVFSFILSPLHMIVYGIVLVVFHVIQWISLRIGKQPGQKIAADYLNYFLIKSLWVVGIKTKFTNPYTLPTDRPIIFVTNHQSHYDISPMGWFLRKHSPKFLAKIELERGIPSVSYNLRNGGSIFIDPDDPRKTLKDIRAFGQYLAENNFSGVIFPEGKRNYDGVPSEFHKNGVKMLVKFTPNALVVPITINNAWKILKNGYFQIPLGITTSWEVHKPIEPNDFTFDELMNTVETEIVKNITIDN